MAFNVANTSYVIPGTTPGWRKTGLGIDEQIIMISPEDYVMYTNTGNGRMIEKFAKWQQRDLPARTDRDLAEGGTYTYETVVSPTIVQNTAQIIQVGVEISETEQASAHYGIKNMLKEELGYGMSRWKGAAEAALIRSVESAGATNVNRKMDGLFAAITTHASTAGYTSLTETKFIDLIRTVWEAGTEARDVISSSNLRVTMDGFSANNKQQWHGAAAESTVYNSVAMYKSTWGNVRNWISRDFQNTATGELVAIDFRKWKKTWLRPVKVTKVDTSDIDALRMSIVGEFSLHYMNERSAAKLTGIRHS